MALQSSGPISFADINAEFARGAGTQLSMSQLYRGGSIVPNATVNQNIPTSGAISLNQFYGATRRVAINITISSNQTNYVLNTAKAAGYVAGISDVVVTINSGIYVSANSTGVYALDVDTSWAAGDTLQIVNNGFIIGMGGAGGAGGYIANQPRGSAGSAGGPAFVARRAVSLQNNGTIAGGGGGGGGGQGAHYTDAYGGTTAYTGGGGGGGGRSSAAANAAGGSGQSSTWGTSNGGGTGTVSAAGGGGAGVVYSGISSGSGGGGGGWGSAGSSGGLTSNAAYRSGTTGPFDGGGAGAAVAGNGNITWLATGTRLGAIT